MKITLYEKTFDNELVHNSLVVNFCYAFFTHIFFSVFLRAVREVSLSTFFPVALKPPNDHNQRLGDQRAN